MLDATSKVSSSTITGLVMVCCFLIFFGIVVFIFVKNNYPKNGMAVLWGALGYYLWINCFSKIVYLLISFVYSVFANAQNMPDSTLAVYKNITAVLFIVLFSFAFMTWTWAFYRFFVLLKSKTDMGKAINTGFGFCLLLLLETFVATASDWINSIGYNATTIEAMKEQITDPEQWKKFEEFMLQLINRSGLDCFNIFLRAFNYTVFIFSVFVIVHTFSTSKEAKKCFMRGIGLAILFFGVEFAYQNKWIPWDILGLVLQLVTAFFAMICSLKWLHCYDIPAMEELMERFKKGIVSLVFSNHNTKKSAAKQKNSSNFADFHKLNNKGE